MNRKEIHKLRISQTDLTKTEKDTRYENEEFARCANKIYIKRNEDWLLTDFNECSICPRNTLTSIYKAASNNTKSCIRQHWETHHKSKLKRDCPSMSDYVAKKAKSVSPKDEKTYFEEISKFQAASNTSYNLLTGPAFQNLLKNLSSK